MVALERLLFTKTTKTIIEEKDENHELIAKVILIIRRNSFWMWKKNISYLENNRLYELEIEIRKELLSKQ